jgi:hypothetical protein
MYKMHSIYKKLLKDNWRFDRKHEEVPNLYVSLK